MLRPATRIPQIFVLQHGQLFIVGVIASANDSPWVDLWVRKRDTVCANTYLETNPILIPKLKKKQPKQKLSTASQAAQPANDVNNKSVQGKYHMVYSAHTHENTENDRACDVVIVSFKE